MGIDPRMRDESDVQNRLCDRPRKRGLVFALVALALMLAIGFFYLTNDKRNNRPAEAVTGAAEAVDDTVRMVGDAAKDAADRLRNQK